MKNCTPRSISLPPEAVDAVNRRRRETLESFSATVTALILSTEMAGKRILVDMRDTPSDFPVVIPVIYCGRVKDRPDDQRRPQPYAVGMVDVETCENEQYRAVTGPFLFPMSAVVG